MIRFYSTNKFPLNNCFIQYFMNVWTTIIWMNYSINCWQSSRKPFWQIQVKFRSIIKYSSLGIHWPSFWHIVFVRRHQRPNLWIGQTQIDRLLAEIPRHTEPDPQFHVCSIVQYRPDHFDYLSTNDSLGRNQSTWSSI